MNEILNYNTNGGPSKELQRIAGYRQNNDWGDLRKHLTYQLMETIEQVVAFNERDQLGYRDASADIRILLDAQNASVTYSLADDYVEVANKLYTRFDNTKELAEKTQQKYNDLGVPTYIVHDSITGMYVNRVKEDTHGTDGEYYPKDKWLKSVNYKDPSFSEVSMVDSSPKEKINVVRNRSMVALFGTLEEVIAAAKELEASLDESQ